MGEALTALPDTLFNQLQKEKFVMLSTVDAETGGPANNAISWVYAVDSSTIRFAVDRRSRLIANMENNPKVTVTFFAEGSVQTVYGTAGLKVEVLEDVPFKLACYDIVIDAIRDSMFYGSRISVEPEYEKTYDKRAAEKLDNQVFAAMKKA